MYHQHRAPWTHHPRRLSQQTHRLLAMENVDQQARVLVPHVAAKRIGKQTVSLPLSPAMSNTDQDRVISAIRDILNRKK